MTTKMSAEALQAYYRGEGQIGPTDGPQAPKRHRRDLEGPLHLAVRDLFDVVLPRGAIYHHSPNELDMSGKNAQLAVAKAKARGMRPGWGDFEIIHGGRFYMLELKAGSNTQSPEQREVERDVLAAGGEYAVARSVSEARDILAKWGLVR